MSIDNQFVTDKKLLKDSDKNGIQSILSSRKTKGILCILSAAFFFSLMNVFIRLSGDVPSIQKSFFRNAVAMLFALAIVLRNHTPLKLDKSNWLAMFCRASFGLVGILCNFYAVDHLNLADATMLNKLSPFFAILFSFFLLREKVSLFQGICVAAAFGGSMLIVKPGMTGTPVGPAMIGLLGGMGAGMAYTIVRILGNRGVRGPIIVFYFSAFSSLALLPNLIFNYSPMSWIQFLTLLCAGLAAAGGQFSITAAYTFAPARELSVYDYTQVIFGAIFGFFIFGQLPDIFSVTGYIIIIGVAILMFVKNQK